MLDDIGGVYCEDVEVAETEQSESLSDNGLETRGIQMYSLDESNAKRLWALSEELTGIVFQVR